MNPRIVCAAIRNREGKILCGPRHFDVTMRSAMEDNEGWVERRSGVIEQGFVDQFGHFYNRSDAWAVAEKEGQIIRDKEKCVGTLYSEHLY
jgi:hypothetical protein